MIRSNLHRVLVVLYGKWCLGVIIDIICLGLLFRVESPNVPLTYFQTLQPSFIFSLICLYLHSFFKVNKHKYMELSKKNVSKQILMNIIINSPLRT